MRRIRIGLQTKERGSRHGTPTKSAPTPLDLQSVHVPSKRFSENGITRIKVTAGSQNSGFHAKVIALMVNIDLARELKRYMENFKLIIDSGCKTIAKSERSSIHTIIT